MHLNPSDLIAHAPALFDAAVKILAALVAPVLTMLVARRLGQPAVLSAVPPALPPAPPPTKLLPAARPKKRRRRGGR